MLVIKTGMESEAIIARKVAPSALVLTGQMTVADFQHKIPGTCSAILSFGLCGGLVQGLKIGECMIADKLVTPKNLYTPDPTWRRRMMSKTKTTECIWWSSGDFNTANTPKERDDLHQKTGASVIDDESMQVAEFATQRNISFAILRTVSDGTDDLIPDAARNALKADGTTDIWSVLRSVLRNPTQVPSLVRLPNYFRISLDALNTAGQQIGPTFEIV